MTIRAANPAGGRHTQALLKSSIELGEASVGGTISPDDKDNDIVAYYLVK